MNTLRLNVSADPVGVANALSSYITLIAQGNFSRDPNLRLSPTEIDHLVSDLSNLTLTLNTNTSFLMLQSPNPSGRNTTYLGGTFSRGQGGLVIDNVNFNNVLSSSDVTAAAMLSPASLINVISLNMLIIDNTILYENVDSSNGSRPVSAVMVVALRTNSSTPAPINISLIFQVLPGHEPNIHADYVCAYYDLSYRVWNTSGCTVPTYTASYNRYTCSCNHLSTFALVRLLRPTTYCRNDTHFVANNGSCLVTEQALVRHLRVKFVLVTDLIYF